MRISVGIIGGLLVAAMLALFFTFPLPRRVTRDSRIVRRVPRLGWSAWRLAARRLPPVFADTITTP